MQSKRLIKTGETAPTYQEFINNIAKDFEKKLNFTPEKAREQAEAVASMYKHTFAEYREEEVQC